MRHLNIISILILTILCSCAPSSDNREQFNRFSQSDSNKFFADPLVFYESDSLKPRLDLNIELPIENISFQKDYPNQIYLSKITLTVNVKNAANENIITKTYVETTSYNYKEIKEKSKGSQFWFYNYSVIPGKYIVEVVVKDDSSNNFYKRVYDISAKDFKSLDISFSDLTILSKVDVNPDGTKEITPHINSNIFGLKEIFAFFEIYNNTGSEISKEYIVKPKDRYNSIIKEYTLSYSLLPGKNQKFESIFINKELMNYIQKENNPDTYWQNSSQRPFFNLEVLNKANNIVVAEKKLMFFPDKLPPEMMNRPPPRR